MALSRGLPAAVLLAVAAVLCVRGGAAAKAAAEAPAPGTRICLNTIMKDEKDNLEKCLKLVTPELAGWTLCDTGSKDGTPKLAEKFFKKAGVPGTVAHHKWKDFSANRNLCIEAGVKFSLEQAKKAGLPKGTHFCDYLWFLDADQFLHLPPDVKAGEMKALNLTKPVYYMMEGGMGISYQNVRLASTAVEWEWVGEVHEYVHRKDGFTNDRNDVIEGYWLEHDASGGNDGKRFVRDEEILRRVIKERPTDPRARFYFANTLRALQRTEEAIEHYIARIKIGGWEEEKFMSAYNIAELVKKQHMKFELVSPQVKAHLANWDATLFKSDEAADAAETKALAAAKAEFKKANETAEAASKKGNEARKNSTATAVEAAHAKLTKLMAERKARQFPIVAAAYAAAAQVLPYRPEPWTKLARMYRLEKNDFERCWSYAAAGRSQGATRIDALFLDSMIARYDLLDEACACGYYVDRVLSEGQLACRQLEQRLAEELELRPNNPAAPHLQKMLQRTRDNLGWYDKKGGCDGDSKTCPWTPL